MIKLKYFLFVLGCLSLCKSLPVKENKEAPQNTENEVPQGEGEGEDWELSLEYGRYLKEVVQALESDPEFRKKLETANVDDIKSGKISRELHLVDHGVRTKLDELKRRELERLRHIAVKEHEKKIGVDRTKLKIPVHVDHRNPSRFEAEDLKKLITQLNHDLEIVDDKRQKEFKTYEMDKEYEYKHKLEGVDEAQKKVLVQEHEEEAKKHKEHPKLHHPVSKQQLEEVWEDQDHMKSEDFDPKTFFRVHDLDGNGYWDENEVKALFQKELDKMYDPNAPEDDLNERYEDMERMREHVFGETDIDRNNLISFEEFLEQSKKSDFEKDEGWQGLDEQEVYSQQEYAEYERQREQEMRRLVETGEIPPPPGYHAQPMHVDPSHMGGVGIPPSPGAYMGNAPQGYHDVPQGYQAVPQGYQGVPQGYQAVPQGYQGGPQGQGYQGIPQGYQAVPQGYQDVPQGYHPVQGNQVPQGYQAVPQAQMHQAAPQMQAVPQVPQIPQGQSVHQAQNVPQAHAVPQGGQAVPQGQKIPAQPQGVPQAQRVPQGQPMGPAQGQQGQVGSRASTGLAHKSPESPQHEGGQQQFQQPGGVVLQHQQDDLNQQPEMRPVGSNHLP